jgi:putative nucleotidyltransferase with HDIG domain
MEVNKLLKDYNTSINTLADRIEKDQAITAKILKLVNSSFYGFRSKIGNIRHAVSLLGFNTVRNAVVSVALIDSFSSKSGSSGFDFTDFWSHSVAVAITSKYLAEKTRLHTPDDCFIGGLLHDIGIVVIAQYFRKSSEHIWAAMQNQNLSFHEAEKAEGAFDHAEIGGYLAQKWHLPPDLIEVIRCHHHVKKNVQNLNFLLIVHTANIVATTFIDNPRFQLQPETPHPEATALLGTYLDTAPDWFPAIGQEIAQACQFFLEGANA